MIADLNNRAEKPKGISSIGETGPILQITGLCFSYGEQKIIDQFDLSLARGERICMAAASGKGKTTLLRLIAGLEKPALGEVRVAGRVAYLFQEDRLLPWKTAAENLMLVGASREEALHALREVGLDGAADRYPTELSGGMNRRVAIARTLCYGGDLLLLDEPFSGIDAATRDSVSAAILRRFDRAAILLITHIPEEAERLGATVIPADLTKTVTDAGDIALKTDDKS